MDFIWDTAKAAANEKKHGVDFDMAMEVFLDPGRIEWHDAAHSWSEDRWRTIGFAREKILFVVFTEWDGETIRIITARKAKKNEQRKYYQKNS